MPDLVNTPIQVSKKFVSEYEDENRTEKIKHEIANDIRPAINHEYRFETEAIRDGVDDVLHEFPQTADADDNREDARAGVTAVTERSGVDESAEKR
ncbi:hypothetical protein GCM10009000_062190 [Halobacterium noricense]